MDNINWKYIKPLSDKSNISSFEKANNIQLPRDIVSLFSKYNGGRPDKTLFDTDKSKERVVKSLLSFNDKDLERVADVYYILKNETPDLFPFASDPAGNFICYDLNSQVIVFWLHETNETEWIANSLSDFLSDLYK